MCRCPTSTIHRQLDLPYTETIQTTHITTYAFPQAPRPSSPTPPTPPQPNHRHISHIPIIHTRLITHLYHTRPTTTTQADTHLIHPTITSHSTQHTRHTYGISNGHTTSIARTTHAPYATYILYCITHPFPRPNHSRHCRIHPTLQTENPYQ